ncbi:MAG TPA: 30S ribosomal protein S4 [Dehalococcoidia bacterium]|nr:30S ribosomal protein S4 [Dehalococcoidia bacterium]
MARYIEAKCRLCRRAADKLMLKGERCFTAKCAVERRNAVPGQKANAKRRPKISDRGIQLREKQKARYTYGIFERQFRKGFKLAETTPGITGDNLIVLLERRLDNIVYRLGYASSRAQARQIVLHGHILLNGHRTDIPSCLVKAGDTVSWRANSTKNEYFKIMVDGIKDKVIPGWLSLDAEKLGGKVLALPTPADLDVKFDAQAIVEYYSR